MSKSTFLLLTLAVGMALTACAPTGSGLSTEAPTTTATTGASPTTSATPSAVSSTSPPSPLPSPSTPGNSATGAAGCIPNGIAIPAGATTAIIGDVDGDQQPDTEFYTEVGAFRYGIHTASGATVLLPDDLAGPGAHSGWSAPLDGPAIVATVLDDGRSASLHAFINCSFVTTMGTDGQPYRFLLNGFGEHGTGVACNNRNGGTLIEGALAQKRGDGLYDIQWTHINMSADGTTATNGTTETRYAGLAESDPLVKQAMGSYCNDVPKVSTSGR